MTKKLNSYDSREMDISSAIVSKMWKDIGYSQGVLLTHIEAVLGDSRQATAFKSLLRRELNTMGGYLQNTIYEEWKIQERGVGATEPAPIVLNSEE